VELVVITLEAVAALALGTPCKYNATVPATCGEAIEVPLRVAVAVLLPIQSEVMLTPGANTSSTEPMLENDALVSVISVAPTVMACVTRAGE